MTKNIYCTLITGLISLMFFTSSCQEEAMLESVNEEEVMASAKLMDFVIAYDSTHIDSTIVDTTIIDDREEDTFYDLFNDLDFSYSDKKSVKEGDEQPIDGLIDNNDDKEEEEESEDPKEEEVSENIGEIVPTTIDEGSPVSNEYAVYIHVKWGCNGNMEVIELICEHSTNPQIFSGVEYLWTSSADFANNITNSNYAILAYEEEEVVSSYNVTLQLMNFGELEVFDFCFILGENNMINCGEENNMIQEACDAVALENMPVQFNFKSSQGSCYFFPLKGGGQSNDE